MEDFAEKLVAVDHLENKKRGIGLLSVIGVSACVLILVFIATAIFFFNKKVDSVNSTISGLTAQINTLTSDNDSLKSKISEYDKFSLRINNVERMNMLNNMQHRIEGGLVTDDFVIEKITFIALPKIDGNNGFLSTEIDLLTQPQTISKYTGQGKFNVPDRELKAMVMDIVDKVSSEYRGVPEIYKDMPEWKQGTHLVTIKNYEIGTVKDGVFKLKGE